MADSKKSKSKQSRKCIVCLIELASDQHLACLKCRKCKKGPDVCVIGKDIDCKICHPKDDSHMTRHRTKARHTEVDDSILDEDTEISAVTQPSKPDSSLQDTLEKLVSQVSTLASRMTEFESQRSSNSLSDTSKGPGATSRSVHKSISSATTNISSTASAASVSRAESITSVLPDYASEGESEQIDTDFDPDRQRFDQNTSEDTVDPSYVEMLQSIKTLLEIQEPEVISEAPPSAFSRRVPKGVTKKQQGAFPPEQILIDMWKFRDRKLSGTDSKGNPGGDVIRENHFLPFDKVRLHDYLTIPQLAPLKAPRVPEAFANICKSKTPSSVSIPMRQCMIHETVDRENVQILEHVVYFQKALEEINFRILDYAEEIKDKSGDPEISSAVDFIIKHCQLQQSITASIEKALDTVLNQTMTSACNLLLTRRDTLLRDVSSNISSQDISSLRTSSVTSREVFPAEMINQVENNLIKRLSVRRVQSSPKRQKRDYTPSDFSRSRQRSGFSGHSQQPFRQNAGTRPRGQNRGTRATRPAKGGSRK